MLYLLISSFFSKVNGVLLIMFSEKLSSFLNEKEEQDRREFNNEMRAAELAEYADETGDDEYDPDQLVSITEAAKINGVTRQAIYVAIKLQKLKATKSENSSRWLIRLGDLDAYRKEKYSRSKSTFDGELIFDNMKGYYSVNQTADMLKVPAQKIYYATRVGMIKASRKGAAWVIHTSDIEEYRNKYLSKKNLRELETSFI